MIPGISRQIGAYEFLPTGKRYPTFEAMKKKNPWHFNDDENALPKPAIYTHVLLTKEDAIALGYDITGYYE
jgi:hypothetical protein